MVSEVMSCFNSLLEDTAQYAGLLLAPAEGFSLWPRAFLALRAKKAYYAVWPILGHFWCLVVPLVIFSGNLIIFFKKFFMF